MGGSEIKHLDLTQIKTDICCFLNSTWIVEGHNCIHQIHFIIYSKLVPKMTFSSSLEHKVSNIKISEVFPILCCTPLYKIVSVYGLHSAEEKKNSLKKNIWGQNFIFCEVFLYCLFLQKLYWDFHFHISEWSISSPLFCLGFIQSTSAKLEKSLIRKKMNWQTHKGLVYPFYYSNPHHIELASAFKIRQRIAIPSKRSSNQYLSTAHWHDCTREKPIHLISIVINILRMDYLQMWEEWW